MTSVDKQIRGSSLLLLGRIFASLLNFCAQVLMVRHLAKEHYGAFAYALSVVVLCEAFTSLGLRTSIPRFVPIYHEKREYEKLFGTIALSVAAICILGSIVISLFTFWPGLIRNFLTQGSLSLVLLSIIVFLVPIEALNLLLIELFASFGNARAIFFRKHLLGPGLKFLVILLLIVLQSDVFLIAYGYVAASLAGVLVSLWTLIRMFHSEGLLKGLQLKRIQIPFKEVISFTIPGLSSEFVPPAIHSIAVLLLGYFYSPVEVAYYSVVFPLARFNRIVMSSITPLYVPSTARLFAKRDYEGISSLYHRTTIWMALFSFPLFAATFSSAHIVVQTLYGERYVAAAPILALLSLGFYLNVLLGCNAHTLKVVGKVRLLLGIDAITLAVNIAANLMLIPRFGAVGAGAATALAMILHSALLHVSLRRVLNFSSINRENLEFYTVILLVTSALFIFQSFTSQIYIALPILAAACLFLIATNRARLDIAQTFPELLRLPLMRALLTRA